MTGLWSQARANIIMENKGNICHEKQKQRKVSVTVMGTLYHYRPCNLYFVTFFLCNKLIIFFGYTYLLAALKADVPLAITCADSQ